MSFTLDSPNGIEGRLPSDEVAQLMQQRVANYLAARNGPSLYKIVRNLSPIVSDDYGKDPTLQEWLPKPLMALVDQLETQLATAKTTSRQLLDDVVSELTARA